MPLYTIAINGTPIEEKNLRLTEGGPAISGLNRSREFVSMPGRAGGLFAPSSTIEARVFRFVLSTSEGIANFALRQTLLDELRDLFEGTVELTFATGPSRKITGVCRVFDGAASEPMFVNPDAAITVEVACENAAFMDSEPTQLVLSSTPAAVQVGTVGHDGRFYLTGANTTPFTIIYRDQAGTLWGQLNITPNLATGERMVIDLASQQIAKVNSSDVASLQPGWDTGSNWFHILPRDANRETGGWPTLEASAAVLYQYRRNWEH